MKIVAVQIHEADEFGQVRAQVQFKGTMEEALDIVQELKGLCGQTQEQRELARRMAGMDTFPGTPGAFSSRMSSDSTPVGPVIPSGGAPKPVPPTATAPEVKSTGTLSVSPAVGAAVSGASVSSVQEKAKRAPRAPKASGPEALTQTADQPAKEEAPAAPTSTPDTQEKQPNLPGVAAPEAPGRTVERINNGQFWIQSWKEGEVYYAQIEVGQDPAVSGLQASGATSLVAMAEVAELARNALASKATPPATEELAGFEPPTDVPPALLVAPGFRAVMDWMVSPEGGGYSLTDAAKITAHCVALRPKVLAISRMAGDIGQRVSRTLELIAMDRANT